MPLVFVTHSHAAPTDPPGQLQVTALAQVVLESGRAASGDAYHSTGAVVGPLPFDATGPQIRAAVADALVAAINVETDMYGDRIVPADITTGDLLFAAVYERG